MEAIIKNNAVPAPEKKKGFSSFYSKGEEIFNAVSHIVGGAFGVAVWITLCILAYPSAVAMVASSVFSASIIILYTMSALYHFLPNGRAKGVFRIFDHCTIFLLIAGTYTPYCLIALGGTTLGIVTLAIEWVCAAAGITMNAIAMNNKAVKGISMALYLTMGWLALLGFGMLAGIVSSACLWLLL
ncbi:MAG: hemolysin III family protein, partial [Clostridia bacterium]|nr:hemolysin III family protein [Clostridia bacterium]